MKNIKKNKLIAEKQVFRIYCSEIIYSNKYSTYIQQYIKEIE